MSDTFFLRSDSQDSDEKLEKLSKVIDRVMEIILKSIEQLTDGLENLEGNIISMQNKIPNLENQVNGIVAKQTQMEKTVASIPKQELSTAAPPVPTNSPRPIPSVPATSPPSFSAQKPKPLPKAPVSPRSALTSELKNLFSKMKKAE